MKEAKETFIYWPANAWYYLHLNILEVNHDGVVEVNIPLPW